MRKKKFVMGTIATISLALIALGCETMGQSAGLGGLLGAGAGAIIGNQSGHALEGALIGGALGALAGAVVHDVKTRQVKNAQQTTAEYEYVPEQGLKIVGESAGVNPTVVQPGGTITTSVSYAVMGAGPNGITVNETRVLKRNGEVLKEVSTSDFMRTDGTWESTQEINFPTNAPAGNYEVAQKVSAANIQVEQNVGFTIAAAE